MVDEKREGGWDKVGPLTPALSPSEGERGNRRPIGVEAERI